MNDIDDLAQLTIEALEPLSGVALRVAANKLRRVLDGLDPPAPASEPPPQLPPMTVGEATHFGLQPIPFGQHAGTPYRDVPREYLDWLVETKRNEWRELCRYLRHPLAPEREYADDDE